MDRMVRSAVLTGFAELARSCGLDPARLMASVGLDITDLAHPDMSIPESAVAHLLESSAAESGRADFAVRMSGFRRISALGPLALVLREEPDLRSALELLIRHEHVGIGTLDGRLAESDGLVTVQVWLEAARPVPLRQSLDLATANLVGIIRALVRSDWVPLAACFSHPAPADLGTFREVFGPGLRFDQDVTGIVFHARELDAPTITSDPALRPYTRLLLESVAPPSAATAADQVRGLVEDLLPSGRCSMAEISRTLGVEPRTVHRHLADEGNSFSAILRTTRAGLAERYLANDRYSLTGVSQRLGFASPGAFSSWFRLQFGITATEWRHRARSAVAIAARG